MLEREIHEIDTQERLHTERQFLLGHDSVETNTTELLISIDPEFKSLNRKLTNEELEQLEDSLTKEGIRDPLVLWRGIIIDGHNRFEIALKHGLEYKIVENTNLDSREEVVQWIIKNQLARRNLTAQEVSYYRGKLYESLKKSRGRQADDEKMGQNDPLRTSEDIAEKQGVSEKTVRRDANFSQAVDKLGELLGEDTKGDILSGESKVTKKDIEHVVDIAEEDPETAKQIVEGKKTVKDYKREKNRQKKAKEVAEKTTGSIEGIGKFPVIYADPPWQYDFSKSDNREIENHYPTMSLEDICKLNISEIANDDCVLFLWATSPKLDEALHVIKEWGFEYKTCMVWVKDKIGMGYYARQQHELLLIATKGSLPTPEPSVRPSSVISANRGQHSKKPTEVYCILEKMYPDFPKVELFARERREGWDTWGNEL